jgi:hypothetical protein
MAGDGHPSRIKEGLQVADLIKKALEALSQQSRATRTATLCILSEATYQGWKRVRTVMRHFRYTDELAWASRPLRVRSSAAGCSRIYTCERELPAYFFGRGAIRRDASYILRTLLYPNDRATARI